MFAERLGYADCLGWSCRGGSEPLPYDDSGLAQVAWVRSSEGLPDAVELFVKRPGLDPLTSATRKDLHIDWTGLERRTYSVRLLYSEVQTPTGPKALDAIAERAPVVEGGNPACWRGGFTFERCCRDSDDSCWDSSFTFDRCCSLTAVKRYADFNFKPPQKPHYELLHLERDNKPRLGPVQDDEALLLYSLVRALRPRTIVEFGTSNGFSALNWMHAIAEDPDARVFSYDILPYPAARALEDSDPRFLFHQKSQADFEPADVDGRPIDVAFFDAGHLIEYSLKAFERLRPALAPNALVAVHDTGLHVRDFGSGAPPEAEIGELDNGSEAAEASPWPAAGAKPGPSKPRGRKPDSGRGAETSPRLASSATASAQCRSRPRFSVLAQQLEKVAAAKGKGSMDRKVELLKELFDQSSLDDAKALLKLLTRWGLHGSAQLRVGSAVLQAAVADMQLRTESAEDTLAKWLATGEVADIAEGWQRLLEQEPRSQKALAKFEDFTVQQAWEEMGKFTEIEDKGAVARRTALAARVASGCGRRCPAGAKYACRMLQKGKSLGIGASDKTVALAFTKHSKLSDGGRLLEMLELNPDIDAAVENIKNGSAVGTGSPKSSARAAHLWWPISPSTAKPAKSIDEVLAKVNAKGAPSGWRAEWKYDGERLQIHADQRRRKIRFELFSRNLKNVTARFPEIAESLKACPFETIILDAEVVAVDGDKILPFQILSRRPREATPDSKRSDVAFFAFDCLFLDGKSLLREPLAKRLELMQTAVTPASASSRLKFAEGTSFQTQKELQKALDVAIKSSTEGLMLKQLDAKYEPGIRTSKWLKLKKDYLDSALSDSIDAVVVGVKRGNGKRSSVYGSYLLAVRQSDDAEATYQTLCATGTGMTHQELQDYYDLCRPLVADGCTVPARLQTSWSGSKLSEWQWISDISKAPVMEITGADLTVSRMHSCAAGLLRGIGAVKESGLALRFPRVLRLRAADDKTAAQATTAEQVLDMYQKQPGASAGTPKRGRKRSLTGVLQRLKLPKAVPAILLECMHTWALATCLSALGFATEAIDSVTAKARESQKETEDRRTSTTFVTVETDVHGYCVGRAHRPSERPQYCRSERDLLCCRWCYDRQFVSEVGRQASRT
ncbi:lig-1 [Symbiodinium sp. CCMP2592]|nr:lig-1 [Symbiodinium sp. CCMP2592]